MENESENKTPRKRPAIIAFLIAGVGLFLLAGAVDALALHQQVVLACMLVVAGVVLVFLAVLCGKGRV
jgi:hypothetical protein